MGQFKCTACGVVYNDSHTFTACPICLGLGRANERCTCSHYQTSFGHRLNVIAKTNPHCPIHGDRSPVPDKASA